MAGYIYSLIHDENTEFHVGEPKIAEKINRLNGYRRMVTLQLDGDEMDAALWGLDNYNKRGMLHSDDDLIVNVFDPPKED